MCIRKRRSSRWYDTHQSCFTRINIFVADNHLSSFCFICIRPRVYSHVYTHILWLLISTHMYTHVSYVGIACNRHPRLVFTYMLIDPTIVASVYIDHVYTRIPNRFMHTHRHHHVYIHSLTNLYLSSKLVLYPPPYRSMTLQCTP